MTTTPTSPAGRPPRRPGSTVVGLAAVGLTAVLAACAVGAPPAPPPAPKATTTTPATAPTTSTTAITTTTSTTTTTLPPSTVDQASSGNVLGYGGVKPPCAPTFFNSPASPWQRGQVVTAGRSGTMDRIDVHLIGGAADHPARLEVTTVTDGLPTATVLSTTDFVVGAGVDGLVDVDLDQPVPVAAGTPYAVLLTSREATCAITSAFSVEILDNSSYATGTSLYSLAGAPWAPGTGDVRFRTWVR